MEKPKLIFKYRSVATLKELVRIRDIVQNNQLYLPTIPQLNDPITKHRSVSGKQLIVKIISANHRIVEVK